MSRQLTDEELLDFANILSGYCEVVYKSIYNKAKEFYECPDKETRMLFYDTVFAAGKLLSEARTLEFQAKLSRDKDNEMP